MLNVVNVVVTAQLNCCFPLPQLARTMYNVIYNPHQFTAMIIRSRKIKGTCLLFPNGKIVVNGCTSRAESHHSVRQFARQLQRHGYSVRLSDFKVQTMTGVQKTGLHVDMIKLAENLGAEYNPDISPGVIYRHGKLVYIIQHKGSVIVSGAKTLKEMVKDIPDVILNMYICSRK